MSGTKRFKQVDPSTGEEIDGFVAVIRPKQKSSFQRHITMNQDTMIAMANDLNHEQFRVMFILLADLDYENYIQISQTEVANALNMQKTNVSRAIKNLLLKGILIEGRKVGRSKTYRLNPSYGWKGTIKNHDAALKHGLTVINGGIQ